jgi:ribonuclease T1
VSRPVRAPLVTAKALLIAASIVVVVLLAAFGISRVAGGSTAPTAGSTAHTATTPSSGLPTMPVAALPPQARSVLALIDQGGPFRYKQDDTVFTNFEGLLPARASGYYHEYTVVTPGSPDRGRRRLAVGRDGDVYYTNDHYESFRQVIR